MSRDVPIRAVSRSLDALKVINRYGRMTLGDIAKEVDVPYVTACRIVQTLVVEGLIVREPSRNHYRPTALVQHLVSGFAHEDDLVRISRPLLLDFTRESGWPVSVSIPIAGDMMMRVSTHASAILLNERCFPGFTQAVASSVPGRLALACGAGTMRSGGHLAEDRNGYGLNPRSTSSIAVPVFVKGGFVAALTMTFTTRHLSVARALPQYLPQLQSTAAAIAHDLARGIGPAAAPAAASVQQSGHQPISLP